MREREANEYMCLHNQCASVGVDKGNAPHVSSFGVAASASALTRVRLRRVKLRAVLYISVLTFTKSKKVCFFIVFCTRAIILLVYHATHSFI